MCHRIKVGFVFLVSVLFLIQGSAIAQDLLPEDNGLATYHTAPRYRASESHPFRILGYVLHPVGWALREAVFRPLSYFTSSTETTRSVFGYREPYDFRMNECFSTDAAIPDCRAILPFNYEGSAANYSADGSAMEATAQDLAMATDADRHVYFPDVNFDFNGRRLNDLGKGRAQQIAGLLKNNPGVHVVLEGHADFKGTDAYNTKLGMDRAETVRSELVSLGVASSALSTVTFGKSKPVFEDKSDWARAVNRRVEVHLDGMK